MSVLLNMYLKPLLVLSCVLVLSACDHLPEKPVKQASVIVVNQASQQRDQQLKQKVHDYTQDQALFDVAFDDLNHDGKEDAIVLLKGLDWCGSGGCTMLVFKGQPNQQFDFVSKTTLVDTPVYSTTYLHHEWKQLLVYSPKHGQVMLKFDGATYPLNPSLLPVQKAKLAPNTAKLLFDVTH